MPKVHSLLQNYLKYERENIEAFLFILIYR